MSNSHNRVHLQKGMAKLPPPNDLQKKLLKQTADRKKST